MKTFSCRFLLFVSALLLGASRASANDTLYNMDIFLKQPDIFALGSVSDKPTHRNDHPLLAARPAATKTTISATTPPSSTDNTGGNIVSEVRIGVLAHDEGPFSHQKENGIDGNLEVLFTSPQMLNLIGSPRPHIGATINSQGGTSQGYLGLSWEWGFLGDAFAGFSLGGAVHNGATRTDNVKEKELGCKALFRESVDIGYRFFKRHAIMLHLEHISNAKLCGKNEGLENFGLRYGYKF